MSWFTHICNNATESSYSACECVIHVVHACAGRGVATWLTRLGFYVSSSSHHSWLFFLKQSGRIHASKHRHRTSRSPWFFSWLQSNTRDNRVENQQRRDAETHSQHSCFTLIYMCEYMIACSCTESTVLMTMHPNTQWRALLLDITILWNLLLLIISWTYKTSQEIRYRILLMLPDNTKDRMYGEWVPVLSCWPQAAVLFETSVDPQLWH